MVIVQREGGKGGWLLLRTGRWAKRASSQCEIRSKRGV